MNRLLLLLLVTAAFAFTAVAQDASPTSSASGQTSTSTNKKAKSGDEHAGMAMDHQSASSEKGATLTGCVSASPNAEGMYTLSNAKHKKGIEVGPVDKVK